jgi:hypothetical protein
MARRHPKRCRVCGIGATDGIGISALGFCAEHGQERVRQNIYEIATREGPFYEHWVRRSFLAARRASIALDNAKG